MLPSGAVSDMRVVIENATDVFGLHTLALRDAELDDPDVMLPWRRQRSDHGTWRVGEAADAKRYMLASGGAPSAVLHAIAGCPCAGLQTAAQIPARDHSEAIDSEHGPLCINDSGAVSA